jgi:serine/threonine protein kinase
MATDPLIGQHLDEYRLLSLLGHGGMARVYLGLDVRLKRYVSIKVIDTPFRSDPSYVRRFQLEAQAIAQLEHPYIVRLYRYGEARGLLYMAMQFVEGADLDSVLQSYRQKGDYISGQDASRIIRELCQALDYAHDRGVIHRDVKPSNVILNREGHPFLTDFGLALLAQPETREEAFGTPHYMAPEQVGSGGGATPLSDLYAVGVILYQMFTGELPFDADDPMDVAWMQVNKVPRMPRDIRPAITPEVQAVILRAMAKVPEARYPSGAALADALDQVLALTPAGALAPLPTLPYVSVPEQVTRELDRNPPPPPAETLFRGAGSIPPRTAPPPRRSQPATAERTRAPAMTGRPRPVPVPARRRQRSGFGRALGCLLAALLVVALLTATAMWAVREGSNFLSSTDWSWLPLFPGAPTATFMPEPTQTPTPVPLATAERSMTPTLGPPPPEPPTPTPPAVPAYSLLIVTQGEESLVLVNRGNEPFDMDPLRLARGQGSIRGAEWGVSALAPGECVVAISSPTKSDLPRVPGGCNLATNTAVVRKAKEAFWRSSFRVFYNDQAVATCQESLCEFQIPISP